MCETRIKRESTVGNDIVDSRPLGWSDLFPGTQQALEQLIILLAKAVNEQSQIEGDESLSTSILVAGDRGFGKTTLLLTAKYAIEKEPNYLKGSNGASESMGTALDTLKTNIIWLNMLDLEPTPSSANLLATLLVRVRDALDQRYPALSLNLHGNRVPASILNEGVDKPWKGIDRLVRNATFMWEEAFESGDRRRDRAEEQIAAAEIYSRFQTDFRNAMQSVSKALRTGERDPLLVLPIDHVDRSIDHLRNIVKLLTMVSSPKLWFILAAGREDFQLFLERAFQGELAKNREAMSSGLSIDQTCSIARFQAAATLQRTVPDRNRITIDFLFPKTAFAFPNLYLLNSGDINVLEKSILDGEDTLSNFVGAELNGMLLKREYPEDGIEKLSDLFVIARRLSRTQKGTPDNVREEFFKSHYHAQSTKAGPAAPEQPKSPDKEKEEKRDQEFEQKSRNLDLAFSVAAKSALSVSARTLRDMWKYLEQKRQPKESGKKCEDFLVRMLKIAIDESNLPFWASEQLHNRIIRKNAYRDWVLDMGGKPIRLSKLTIPPEILEISSSLRRPNNPSVMLAELHLRSTNDFELEIHSETGMKHSMPSNVAGWFILLHDKLRLLDRVLSPEIEITSSEMMPDLLVTHYEYWFDKQIDNQIDKQMVNLDFSWSVPVWVTYFEHSVFVAQWRAFLNKIKPLIKPKESASQSLRGNSVLLRLIRAAWIENVCSVAGKECGLWDWYPYPMSKGDVDKSSLGEVVDAEITGGETNGHSIDKYERHVAAKVAKLYAEVSNECQASLANRRGRALSWLLRRSLLIFGPEFSAWEDSNRQTEKLFEEAVHTTRENSLLKNARQELVRTAARKSTAHKEKRDEEGKREDGTSRAHILVNDLSKEWLGVKEVDRNKDGGKQQ